MSSTTKMCPFVKWAGGKKQLIDTLKDCMPSNYKRYYEPFIGGGAFLLDLQPSYAVINDTNEQLLNIYRQLRDDISTVINAVNVFDSIPCDRDHYMSMRDAYNNKIIKHELDAECAAMMIWINKHCFNGLYRVNSKGLFNVPYNNKITGSSIDEDNLKRIGSYLRDNDIKIRQGDFKNACYDASAKDFVYFDSPYVPINKTANFTDYTKAGFSLDDHKRLAILVKELSDKGVFVMLSNNDVPLVHELYKDYNIQTVNVKRFINSNAAKRIGNEVIITNY